MQTALVAQVLLPPASGYLRDDGAGLWEARSWLCDRFRWKLCETSDMSHFQGQRTAAPVLGAPVLPARELWCGGNSSPGGEPLPAQPLHATYREQGPRGTPRARRLSQKKVS